MTYQPPKKVNYLNNREILKEINESKKSFCYFVDEKYSNYDVIVDADEKITSETIHKGIQNRIKRIEQEARANGTLASLGDVIVNPMSIIIRRHTYEHIPKNPDHKENAKKEKDFKHKTTFIPFKHYYIKSMDMEGDKFTNIVVAEGGRSHWENGLDNGNCNLIKGQITNRLALMFMKLVDRYSQRLNWRGYCVDEQTEALTQRGWLTHDQITEDDIILSYENGKLKWSKIKSIFRDDYDGNMFRMTVTGLDALVTPRHKFITDKGLQEIDFIKEKDRLILMGEAVDGAEQTFSDAFVELVGWMVTEGNIYKAKDRNYSRVTIYQNEGKYAERIRACLNTLNVKFGETHKKNGNNTCVAFVLTKEISQQLVKVAKDRVLDNSFMLSLTHDQRLLLINTMVDGDGWRTGNSLRYCQKEKDHVDAFIMLCTISGLRTSCRLRKINMFGSKIKGNMVYQINVFSKRRNVSTMENINLHGGKSNGNDVVGLGKEFHPNQPTEYYKGKVWCPQTEYGSFMARRNGCVYLTGNTYVDEMKAQALLQLSQVGLQFDESKSENPFAYYTAIITTSFTRVLNLETRNQNMRDDILLQHGVAPSHTKLVNHEMLEKYAMNYAKTVYQQNSGLSGDELAEIAEQHYTEHSKKVSAKKEDFKKAVAAYYYDFVLNPPRENQEKYIDAMDMADQLNENEDGDIIDTEDENMLDEYNITI